MEELIATWCITQTGCIDTSMDATSDDFWHVSSSLGCTLFFFPSFFAASFFVASFFVASFLRSGGRTGSCLEQNLTTSIWNQKKSERVKGYSYRIWLARIADEFVVTIDEKSRIFRSSHILVAKIHQLKLLWLASSCYPMVYPLYMAEISSNMTESLAVWGRGRGGRSPELWLLKVLEKLNLPYFWS